MGVKHSVYEVPGSLDYYKFSIEEYALVKKVWSEVEINPQAHGNAYFRCFFENYPQYVKFFVLEHKLPMSFDTHTLETFSKIIEAFGYLLLDFYDKPKQLDRLIGYLAMIHKDMRLNEQDINRFMYSLLDYLSQTYPTEMTAQCRNAMLKYIDNITKELVKKMEIFRCFDNAQLDAVIQSKPKGWCRLFTDPSIFGKTKFYWREWKKRWDAHMDEWTTQGISATSNPTLLVNNENVTATADALRNDDLKETKVKQEEASVQDQEPISNLAAPKLQLSSPSEMPVIAETESSQRVSTSSKALDVARTSRERHRVNNLARDASKPRPDATILRKRLCSVLDVSASESISDEGSEETSKRSLETAGTQSSSVQLMSGSHKTARERRRERFNVHLQ